MDCFQNKRLIQLQESFYQIDWLYAELGMEPNRYDSPLHRGSDLGLDSSPPRSGVGPNLDDPFYSTPTPANKNQPLPSLFASTAGPSSISSARPTTTSQRSQPQTDRAFQRILDTYLELVSQAAASGEELPEGAGLDGVEPTPALLAWAARIISSLEDTKRARESRIQTLYDQLEPLWARLLPASEHGAYIDGFVDAHQGSTEETLRAYEEELERMAEVRREKMGEFVERTREEIRVLWDQLMYGEEEMGAFAPIVDGGSPICDMALYERDIES
jgi:protein regulator of cytokinesis 1